MKKTTLAAVIAMTAIFSVTALAQAPTTTPPAKTSLLSKMKMKMHKAKGGSTMGSSKTGGLLAKLHKSKKGAPATTGSTTTPGGKTGLMSKLHKSKKGASAGSGQIIGDKKTHVYHLPGSGGNLPSAANTVYFPSAAAAEAAGYHAAGSGGKSSGKGSKKKKK